MDERQNSTTASCDGSTDEENGPKQIVFLMLLDDDSKRVLMLEKANEWYLPYYEFSYLSAKHKGDACLQLQKELGFDVSRPYFTALFDPLGFMITDTMNGKPTYAYSHLLLLESHCSHYTPHLPAAWHDIHSVTRFSQDVDNRSRGPGLDVHEVLFGVVEKFLKGSNDPSYQSDTRYRPGWFQSASQYLKSLLAEIGIKTTGDVFQHSFSSTSTILKVDSEHRSYFLKAPAAGCDEVTITRAVAENIPYHTLFVIGANKELNCFVSESFEEYEDEDQNAQALIIDKLAEIQMESLTCVEKLRAAGLPDRSPQAIKEQIENWLDSDTTLKTLLMFAFQKLVDNASLIKQGLLEIDDCGIPSTLVHGDASESNLAYRLDDNGEKTPIMYDWQFSCISHPFFDFHNLHETISSELSERYLQKWTKFAPMDKLRRAFELACRIGWILKLWVAAENLKACYAEECSILMQFMVDCLDEIAYGLRDLQLKQKALSLRLDDSRPSWC